MHHYGKQLKVVVDRYPLTILMLFYGYLLVLDILT